MIERYGITARLFAADCGVYLEISIPDNTVHLQIELRSVSVQKLANGSCPYLLVNNIFSVGPFNSEADYYVNGTKLPQCVMPRFWR